MSDDLRNRVARAIAKVAFLREQHRGYIGQNITFDDSWIASEHYEMADAALAEIGAVRVKPLEWDDNEVMAGGVMTYGSALSPFGRYYLTETGWFGPGMIHSHQPDLEAAKADVKADYTRRILAAIEPAPSVREAARVALERFESCASKMVPEDYAKGYREACEHIRAIAEGKE